VGFWRGIDLSKGLRTEKVLGLLILERKRAVILKKEKDPWINRISMKGAVGGGGIQASEKEKKKNKGGEGREREICPEKKKKGYKKEK